MRQSGLSILLIGLSAFTGHAWSAEAVPLPYVFTLPAGFEIEVIATAPLVERPITADFDEQGRLYVAESSGSNAPVDQQLVERTHSILRLEDVDGDGRFDQRTVFADRMMFPEGTMWLDGSLYVSAPPSIWKLTDTDDDGVADVREEWFQGKTLTGCANDLHGPYRGPDGWIYWCKGAFAEQTYPRPGLPPLVTRASHIFRSRPDGSGIDSVMTGGMDNPVDVTFTSTGERIFTTTFLQNPAGGRRDGLIHAIYGGVYGKENAVLNDHPQTGELLPALVHMGAAAPCGLTTCTTTTLGDDFQGNLFAAQFNMHKVSRHVLTEEGGTYQSHDEDFVVADNLDFHPTDVLEDADGTLVVVDTGGWYKLCCPTSQLSKPDVLGAIYRVRRTGEARHADPRGWRIAWEKLDASGLIALLKDDRTAVRQRAIAALAALEGDAIPGLQQTLTKEPSAAVRRDAIWTLTRIDRPTARAAVRKALDDQDATVRQVALHSISLWRDAAALGALQTIVQRDTQAHCRRLAAEALGRLGDASSVAVLLEQAGQPHDRTLEHALIHALMEINDPTATAAGLDSDAVGTQRAALIALNEMRDGNLAAERVVALLGSAEPVLQETAHWIVGRHDDWGDALSGYLATRLQEQDLSDPARTELSRQLARFASAAAVQSLITKTAADSSLPPDRRLLAIEAMGRGGVASVPDGWRGALIVALEDQDLTLRGAALAAIRALPWGKELPADVVQGVLRIADASDGEGSDGLRVEAAAAVPGGIQQVSPSLFQLLRAHLDQDVDVKLRSAAVEALVGARLTDAQLIELTKVFATVGPLESNRLLAAFERSKSEAVGMELVASLQDSAIAAGVRADAVRRTLAEYPPAVQAAAQDVYTRLNVNLAEQGARLESLLSSLVPGDVRRGQQVFHSKKAACFACHAMGYLGGNVGPDLTQVGRIRTPRDLLESIVFPSASLVRSYEPVVISTTAGLSHSGLIRQELPRDLVLATGVDKEVRISKDEIELIVPGQVSIMPDGLDKQLSLQELSDLLEFLKAAK